MTQRKTEAEKKPKKDRTMAAGLEPEVRWLAEELALQRITDNALALKAGVSRPTITSWFVRPAVPNLSNYKSVIGALGYELAIVPIEDDHDVQYRMSRLLAQLRISDADRLKLRTMASLSKRSVAEVAEELLALLLANGPIIPTPRKAT